MVNVASFGAAGDGVTDDTAAIQAAIDSIAGDEGLVWFPAGEFVVSSIDIGDKVIGLLGAGRNVTQLIASGTGAGAVIVATLASPLSGVRIEGLTINLNATASATGILCSNLQRARIQDVTIDGGAIGIDMATCGTCTLDNLRITDQTTAGIRIDGDGGLEHYFNDVHVECFTGGTMDIAIDINRTTTADTGGLYFRGLRIVDTGGTINTGLSVVCSGGSTTLPLFMDPGCVIDGINGTSLEMTNLAQSFIVGAWITGTNTIAISGGSDHYIGFSLFKNIVLTNAPQVVHLVCNRMSGTPAIDLDPASPPTNVVEFGNRIIGSLTDEFATLAAARAAAPGAKMTRLKTTDETVNNSATLQDDDVLHFPIPANTRYTGEVTLFVTGDATADFKAAINAPAGATVMASNFGPRATDTVMLNDPYKGAGVAMSNMGASASGVMHVVRFSVINGATAGSVTVQWAQSAATVADTTVKAGSFLSAEMV